MKQYKCVSLQYCNNTLVYKYETIQKLFYEKLKCVSMQLRNNTNMLPYNYDNFIIAYNYDITINSLTKKKN